jgi:hypothetical protein
MIKQYLSETLKYLNNTGRIRDFNKVSPWSRDLLERLKITRLVKKFLSQMNLVHTLTSHFSKSNIM